MSFNEDMIAKAPKVAAQLKLLSNPNRLMIVCRLLDDEMSVGDIEHDLDIRQPTLSRELGHLRDAGIISPRRQSKVVFYSLTNPAMRQLIEAICHANSTGRSKPPIGGPDSEPANKIAFHPKPKFSKTNLPYSEDRGCSVFASAPKKGL